MLLVVEAAEPKMLPADCDAWPVMDPLPNILPAVPALLPPMAALDPNPDPNALLLVPLPNMPDAGALLPPDPIDANVFNGALVGLALLSCWL